MEFKNKKEKQIVIVGIILFFAFVIFGLIIYFDGNSELNKINEQNNHKDQENIEEKENLTHINVLYTDNGFAPPRLVTLENRVNFLNRSGNSIDLEIIIVEGEKPTTTYGRSQNIDGKINYLVEFPEGRYVVREINSGTEIEVLID